MQDGKSYPDWDDRNLLSDSEEDPKTPKPQNPKPQNPKTPKLQNPKTLKTQKHLKALII